jgi:hypothetical protein
MMRCGFVGGSIGRGYQECVQLIANVMRNFLLKYGKKINSFPLTSNCDGKIAHNKLGLSEPLAGSKFVTR